MSKEKIHKTWGGMQNRCCNPKSSDYQHYGGRGIKVCSRWSDETIVPQKSRGRPSTQGSLNFYEDMSPTWFEGATIDRIDNDGDYTPDNCRWVTRSENTREMNQRKLADGSHHLLDSTAATASNIKRVKNGTHPWLGMLTVFDSVSNTFVKIPIKEYKEASNDRYYALNSKFVRQIRTGGVL